MKSAGIIDNFIYRQIATRQELEYYLRKIGEQHFQNDYGVVYFSFHGIPEHICLDQNCKNALSFEDLSKISAVNASLSNRHVHFSACETLKCEEDMIRSFKRNVGAKSISGYTEEVDPTHAYINELAYFHQIFKFATLQTIKKHMSDYQNQLTKLGFRII